MIEIKVSELLNSQEVLKELAQKPMRAKTSYAVARIIRDVENEMATFDKTRQEILKKYCIKDENGEMKINEEGNVTIEDGKIDEYNQEIKDLLESRITLSSARPLILKEIEDMELTPSQIYSLSCFIQDDEEVE